MWIKLEDTEIERGLQSKVNNGSRKRWIASIFISLLLSLMYGFGILASKGYVHTYNNYGVFSFRRFLIGFSVVFPIAYFLGKMFVKADVNDSVNLTVCIKCEKKSSGDDGDTCSCGGEMCSLARIKWVE